jgi:predicted RNase H-like HicB family nuclease
MEEFMLIQYVQAAMNKAKYEILSDDGSFYGEINGYDGVFSNADTLEKCRTQLQEVLEEWILIKVSKNLPLPNIDGIDLKITRVA